MQYPMYNRLPETTPSSAVDKHSSGLWTQGPSEYSAIPAQLATWKCPPEHVSLHTTACHSKPLHIQRATPCQPKKQTNKQTRTSPRGKNVYLGSKNCDSEYTDLVRNPNNASITGEEIRAFTGIQ